MDIDKSIAILNNIRYKDDWELVFDYNIPERLTLYWVWEAPDVNDPTKIIACQGREWILPPDFSEHDLVVTAFSAAVRAEEHEVREQFMYKGERPFGPHNHLPGVTYDD